MCKEICRSSEVKYKKEVLDKLKKYSNLEYPICIAKTQYSLSDDANKLGRPEGFEITVKEIKIMAGAGFIVAL